MDYSLHAWGGANNKVIRERLGNCCFNCGADCGDRANIHHIVPRALGGEDRLSNYAILCDKCHYLVHYGVNNIDIKKRIGNSGHGGRPKPRTVRGYITATELSEIKGVCLRTIQLRITKGQIPAKKIDGYYYIRKTDVENIPDIQARMRKGR